MTQVLYYLAVNTEYAQVLREEVQSVVQELGWSKEAMAALQKVDSFVKEAQRMDSLGIGTSPPMLLSLQSH